MFYFKTDDKSLAIFYRFLQEEGISKLEKVSQDFIGIKLPLIDIDPQTAFRHDFAKVGIIETYDKYFQKIYPDISIPERR